MSQEMGYTSFFQERQQRTDGTGGFFILVELGCEKEGDKTKRKASKRSCATLMSFNLMIIDNSIAGKCICIMQVKTFFIYTAKIMYGKFEKNIPRKETARPQSLCLQYIHISVSDLYITTIGLPIWLQKSRWTDPGNI